MKCAIEKYTRLIESLEKDKIVYVFGTGISSSLTGKPYSWYRWINDGIEALGGKTEAIEIRRRLKEDDSADNMISVVGRLIAVSKAEKTYKKWMMSAFETNEICNTELATTLSKMLMTQDVVATTNYDLLLEKATGLETATYQDPNIIFPMLEKNISTHVVHLHGVFDSMKNLDNIIADEDQYSSIYNNEGAQFLQNLLGTRKLIFVGCGLTTEDINISRFIKFANEHLNLDMLYFYLHHSTAELPYMPENMICIDYGDDYNDLPIFLEDMVRYRIRQFLLKHPIIGRTIYRNEKISSPGLLRYHYAQESINFAGREEELRKLNRFLDDKNSFSWWTITGQAGSGKSRLAYELMKKINTKWFSFFLNDNSAVSEVNEFVPFCDTLIVIDYIKGREKEIAEITSRLMNSFKQSDYKLKVLFLERDSSTTSGSWYDLLVRSFGKYDVEQFEQSEYRTTGLHEALSYSEILDEQHQFIHLDDLDAKAVIAIIGDVCRLKGLPADEYRDTKLQKEYEKKFEQIRYRPLFVQIYVEAWIENDCEHPRYDGFVELLKKVIEKEQARWLKLVDGDIETCNALIHILVRAIAGNGLKIVDMPNEYKDDWNRLTAYIKGNTLPGKQRKETLEMFIDDICQTIHEKENKGQTILPLYPDIIKEYMFAYYTDETEIDEISKELWENAGKEFAIFLYRCLTDFRDNEFYIQVIENAPDKFNNPYVMAARLAFLNRKIIQPKDNPIKLMDRIDKEYGYWNSVTVESDSDFELALLKLSGLSFLAFQYGAWMKIDKMMECIQKAIKIPTLEDLNVLKGIILSERINELSKCGYPEEASKLRQDLRKLSQQPEDRFRCLTPTYKLIIRF